MHIRPGSSKMHHRAFEVYNDWLIDVFGIDMCELAYIPTHHVGGNPTVRARFPICASSSLLLTSMRLGWHLMRQSQW